MTTTMQVITWVLTTAITLNTIIAIINGIIQKRKEKKTATLTKEVIEPIINPLKESIDGIKDDLSKVTERIDKNERDRLKDIIINTNRKFEDTGVISDEEFRYCSECFDKYTSLGGNSYVKTVMKSIIDKWDNLHK